MKTYSEKNITTCNERVWMSYRRMIRHPFLQLYLERIEKYGDDRREIK